MALANQHPVEATNLKSIASPESSFPLAISLWKSWTVCFLVTPQCSLFCSQVAVSVSMGEALLSSHWCCFFGCDLSLEVEWRPKLKFLKDFQTKPHWNSYRSELFYAWNVVVSVLECTFYLITFCVLVRPSSEQAFSVFCRMTAPWLSALSLCVPHPLREFKTLRGVTWQGPALVTETFVFFLDCPPAYFSLAAGCF